MRRRTFVWILSLAIILGLSTWVASLSGIHFGNRTYIVTPQRFAAEPVAVKPGIDHSQKVLVTVDGRVTGTDGRPIAGAMVTLSGPQDQYRVTAFSDRDGHYRVTGRLSGDNVGLRARAHGYADAAAELSIATSPTLELDVPLPTLRDAEAVSDSLTASAHAALLEWPDAGKRSAFVSQCHFCHQIGNALTRAPRDSETWNDIVDRMEGYLVMLTGDQKQTIKDVLSTTFTGRTVDARRTPGFSPHLTQTRIEEWAVGDGESFIHDADLGADGRLYGTDEGHDVIWILDRFSGAIERVPLPPSKLPPGGLFSGLALPIGIFTGSHGPHSLAQAEDGKFWITNALSSTLMSYDPKKRSFAVYPVGRDALYPHTVRIDAKGTIWFTLAASNQIARFKPLSGTFTLIDLPANGVAAWISDLFFPLVLKVAALSPRSNLHLGLSHHTWSGAGKDALELPYGIDIHPLDGSVWYAKLYADRIGRIDPRTLQVREFPTPLKGPRRPRFDSQGHVWIPAFEAGAIMRFDPENETFSTYDLPKLGVGEYETPYALNVDRRNDMVWVTSNQSDRVFRFDPQTVQFSVFPSPTRVSFLRDLVFSRDGKVCSSQSNLPASAIEGGVPSFICFDPMGAER